MCCIYFGLLRILNWCLVLNMLPKREQNSSRMFFFPRLINNHGKAATLRLNTGGMSMIC